MSKRVCFGEERESENGGGRWAGMSPELLAVILVRLPAEEMMRVAPLVCKWWRAVVAGPYCWTNIDLQRWSRRRNSSDVVDSAVRKLVRRSRCTFQLLSAYRLGNTGFSYISNCGRCLKVLIMPLSEITDQMVLRHAKSLANLTYLDISYCSKITSKGLEAFGKQCKSLVHLKRNMPPPFLGMSVQETAFKIDDSEAMIISDTMLALNMLELCYGRFGNCGLNAILNKCKALTHLDIEGCWGVGWEAAILENICKRLVVFKSPWVEDYDTEESLDNDTDRSSEDAPNYDTEESSPDSS